MRNFILLPALLALVLAACTAAPAVTPTPAAPAATPTAPAVDTPAPATPTPEPAETPEAPVTTPTPPPATGLTGTECDGIPTFMDPEMEDFEFTRDDELEAMFPTSVQGAPVEELNSFRWIEFVCLLGGQQGLEAAVAEAPEIATVDWTQMSMAMAELEVDDDVVSIIALRMAGTNLSAAAQIEMLAALAAGEGMPDDASLQQTNLGGKTVYVASAEGEVSYMYPIGDVLFMLSEVDESTAAAILAELP